MPVNRRISVPLDWLIVMVAEPSARMTFTKYSLVVVPSSAVTISVMGLEPTRRFWALLAEPEITVWPFWVITIGFFREAKKI